MASFWTLFPVFFSYTASFGLWNWIFLLNKKASPHSFNQETLDKYWLKFKIQLAWSLDYKTKISTKKKYIYIEEEINEINKCDLQKKKEKRKQNKKATVRNLSEKWRKVRWDEALVSWRRRTHRKKVEERGRQHKMTKMRGNLKLRRVEIEECD